MKIYAIGDLHLSGSPPYKPMHIFGENWRNHFDKIKASWEKEVSVNDIVIIAGDTSWALKLKEALIDLRTINELPGKKVFVRGNHDYWWASVTKMQNLLDNNCFFIHNNYYAGDNVAICGSRGWISPKDPSFTENDQKIYDHELLRVETSLQMACNDGFNNIILALHYPPLYTDNLETGFSLLCEKYNVKATVYGHLHNESITSAYQGLYKNTQYHLVSADAIDFKLKKIDCF